MAKALHTDDSVTTCDCCGRSGLKFTVLMELDDGSTANYGSTCAARNTGKTASTINSEIRARAEALAAAARAEYMRHPAHLAERARFAERNRVMPGVTGRAAMEFVREAVTAANVARAEICARHGVNFIY